MQVLPIALLVNAFNVWPIHIVLEQRLFVMLINAFHAHRTVNARLKVQVLPTAAQASACNAQRMLIALVIPLYAALINVLNVQMMLSAKLEVPLIPIVVQVGVCNVQAVHIVPERKSVPHMYVDKYMNNCLSHHYYFVSILHRSVIG